MSTPLSRMSIVGCSTLRRSMVSPHYVSRETGETQRELRMPALYTWSREAREDIEGSHAISGVSFRDIWFSERL